MLVINYFFSLENERNIGQVYSRMLNSSNCYLDQDFDLDQDILLKDERNINDSKIFKQFLFILKFNKQLLLTILYSHSMFFISF